MTAVKFPEEMQNEWLFASTIGFLLDVFVYHTFSLFLKAIMKFLLSISMGTDKSTLALGTARSLDAASCAFAGIYQV